MNRFEGFTEALSADIRDQLSRETDPNKVYALNRLLSRHKKRFRNGGSQLGELALADFISLNEYVSTVDPQLDPFIEHNARLFIEQAFERFNKARDPDLIQCPFDQRLLLNYWRFGPGASNSVVGSHAVEKIYQPMSVTPACEQLVRELRLSNLYMRSYDAVHNRPVTLVSGSRMTTVPKNEECERTIAIEPSGNMCLQLALEGYITDVLRSIGLDIRVQSDINKGLARFGSISGELATIDLKSASDLISIPLCRKLLPRPLFNFMCRVRSTHTTIGGVEYRLNMMSTMGNGFTFPTMTLLFVALIYATRLRNGGPSNFIDWTHTGVFGDDIIVPTSEADELIDVIEKAGFIVNHDKTFTTGPFRESCGGDFHLGYDVTPFYVKELKHDSDVYVAINQCFDYCGKHRFVFDRALVYLRSLIDGDLFLVPEWHADTDGVRCQRVSGRYKHLQPKQHYRRVPDGPFTVMLACGGYIEPRGPDLLYLPRPKGPVRYRVRRSRLPNGYLDGRCVVKRSDRVSSHIDNWLFLTA